MKQALLAAVVLLGVLTPAAAMTGNELREQCASRWDLCHGFIVGAAWMFRFQMQPINPICLGNGTNWDEVHEVVLNYIEDHPESRHEHALILITWAMREAFDCPEAQQK